MDPRDEDHMNKHEAEFPSQEEIGHSDENAEVEDPEFTHQFRKLIREIPGQRALLSGVFGGGRSHYDSKRGQ